VTALTASDLERACRELAVSLTRPESPGTHTTLSKPDWDTWPIGKSNSAHGRLWTE
jgi:hypothetical protein